MEYFQAVVEKGNFYLAADKCHISQSAISQQIIKLEEELGVKLLERHNRTFSLTQAGEHFYRKSLVITGDIDRPVRETKRIADRTGAVLRLGYYKGYYGNELAVSRIPLVRNSEPVTKTYCAFWKKDNPGKYTKEFADILKEEF